MFNHKTIAPVVNENFSDFEVGLCMCTFFMWPFSSQVQQGIQYS
jgi:hypothetical protein